MSGPSARAPRVTVLVNPAAGKGRGAAAGEAAAARLRELGAQVSLVSGGSVADMRRLAAEAIAAGDGRPDALAVVGGDGTLAAILDQVSGSGLPIALVPAGTGNDLARELGLPFGSAGSAGAAAELALTGAIREIDVCEASCPDGRAKYLTIAALGFDAHVSERTNRLRWPKGPLRYYLALVIELVRLRPMAFSIRIDDEPAAFGPGILAAIGNTGSYGGGMRMCPEADPGDGLLDVVHVAPIGRLKLLRLFPLLLRARHLGRAEVTMARGSRVEIEAPGLVVYADGERIGSESVRVELLPGALRVFVPREPVA